MNYWLLLIPCFTIFGFIGYARCLHWLLLHPVKPQKLGPWQVHGIIPRWKKTIVQSLQNETSLLLASLSVDMDHESMMKQAMPMIEMHMDDFLKNKLPVEMPMIGMFIGDKTISSLKEIFSREIRTLFPQILSRTLNNRTTETSVNNFLASKLDRYDEEKVRALLHKPIQKLYTFSFLIGLLVAFIQVLVIVFLP